MGNNEAKLKSVLVVEDEPSIRRIISGILTSEGLEIDAASNGVEAERILSESEYDLIILDIRMPVMNGIDLYTEISQKHPELTKRVLFITGDSMNKEIESFIYKTRRPFLLKPFNHDDLVREAKNILRQHENTS